MNILIRNQRYDSRLNGFGESHRDVTVGSVIIAGDVGHSDRVVDDSEDLLVRETSAERDVRILLQEDARILALRAPLEPVPLHLRLDAAGPE